jgi:putative lipoic acid-binding regulatory protein
MKSQNGGAKNANPFKGKEIEFPVTYELKAVMVNEDDMGESMKKLEAVFAKQKVVYKFVSEKISSKATYISYTYRVTLTTKLQMEEMYEGLKEIKGLKFAL